MPGRHFCHVHAKASPGRSLRCHSFDGPGLKTCIRNGHEQSRYISSLCDIPHKRQWRNLGLCSSRVPRIHLGNLSTSPGLDLPSSFSLRAGSHAWRPIRVAARRTARMHQSRRQHTAAHEGAFRGKLLRPLKGNSCEILQALQVVMLCGLHCAHSAHVPGPSC